MKSGTKIIGQQWYQNPFLYMTIGCAAATCTAWEMQSGYAALTGLVFTGVSGSSLLFGDNGWLL